MTRLADALVKAGVVRREDTPQAKMEQRWEEERREVEARRRDTSAVPERDSPEMILLSDCPSAGSIEEMREPEREAPEPDPVQRVTGTMHWMHKSVPVLEIHGRDNPLLSPEEISKMRRR